MSAETKIAVITGAARGLGRALAMELAQRGVIVAGIGRSADSLTDVARTQGVHPFVADMASPAAVADAFAAITDTLGPLDILINNAAVYPHRDILDETPDSFGATMAVNLGGTFAATHEALKRMVPRGQGRIVNVTTFADRRPAPMSAAYSVSKGAGKILTRALMADLGDRFPDIVVTDWTPGALRTEMGLADGIPPEDAARWGATLALMTDRDLNGVMFDQNREVRPARSLSKRLIDKLLGTRPVVRRL